MDKTTSEILAESRALRLAFIPRKPVAELPTQSYAKPLPWEYMHYQILTEPNFQWQDIVVNIYITDGPVGITSAPVGTTVIIHGHSRDKRCFTKHRCQSLGFKGEEGSVA